MNTYSQATPVISLDENTRGRFVARAYNHLFGAVIAFILIEVLLFKTGVAESMATAMLSTNWLLILGGFVVLSWIARYAAHRALSLPMQYMALAVYVVGEAIIFVPLLYIAEKFAPGAIASAALVTFLGFVGLSLVVFMTRKDFSFLRGILFWGGIVAVVLIVGGVIFGFVLGTFFSVAMVALAGAAILYDTSNILYRYPEDRYVAAALELFASVALMFWYVLRLFISSRR
ncbi:MAG TPA: Bax inhibitor-1 family protein [Verrucomicrobiae bacterium]|nr:Bax inhibitor-1 family protein [Verrucomicrobiae bacterium]